MLILKGLVLVGLVALLAILSFASLVAVLIGVLTRRAWRRTALMLFLCCSCACCPLGVYTGERAWSRTAAVARSVPAKAEGLAEGLARRVITGLASLVWEDNRAYLLDPQHPNPQIERLRSYVPADVLATVNPDYYTYFGFRDWWRIPLVYPYALHAIDTLDCASLADERGVQDFRNLQGAATLAHGITRLALDRNYLLMERGDCFYGSDNDALPFGVFDFAAGRTIASFDTEAELFARARELGYTGVLELISVQEYSDLF